MRLEPGGHLPIIISRRVGGPIGRTRAAATDPAPSIRGRNLKRKRGRREEKIDNGKS